MPLRSNGSLFVRKHAWRNASSQKSSGKSLALNSALAMVLVTPMALSASPFDDECAGAVKNCCIPFSAKAACTFG